MAAMKSLEVRRAGQSANPRTGLRGQSGPGATQPGMAPGASKDRAVQESQDQ